MTRTLLLVVLVIMPQSLLAEGNSNLRLCVSSAAKHLENKSLFEVALPSTSDFSYFVKVDDGPRVETNAESGFEYPLPMNGSRFLVQISDRDGPQESFWIDYADLGTESACLWFKSLYETWSVWPLNKSKHLCDCETNETTD